jgi:gas vesicle protein
MASNEGNAAGAVVVAFVLGAVTGAAVALLMAPTTGEEMRRMIADKARESRERAEEAARQGREFLNRQRDNVSSAIERGREAYQQARTGSVKPGQEAENL